MQPMRLSGLEPVEIGAGSLFVNIGERTNVTGSRPESFIGGTAREVAGITQSGLRAAAPTAAPWVG